MQHTNLNTLQSQGLRKYANLFFVGALFHCFVCALVAEPRIRRTLVVSFDILRRLRLVTALSLGSYKTNVSGCGGLIAFLPIIKRLIPLTESHLVGVIFCEAPSGVWQIAKHDYWAP